VIGRLRISLGAIRNNAQLLRDMVGPKHAAFVVKSNAYGHGLLDVARAAEPLARRICVYAVEEALTLRSGGISKPILVLGPIQPEALDDAMAAKLDVALWDTGEFARRLAAAARKHQTRAPVHVKVNTGLNRLGFEPHELADAIEDYLHVSEIEIAGVFSHFASAEELDSTYTMQQLETFERALAAADPLFERNNIVPLRHIAASAAAMLWPQTRLDLSRFGIALYGLWPSKPTREAANSNGVALEPALSYESELVVVRSVRAGAPIGYGNSYHAPRDMHVGVVPAGYGDGIPRALSNRGAFLVDGASCPVVGRVAMNLTEIDLTNAPGARVGSKVTLLGRDGNAYVGADDWAYWAETINYEIVARLPAELPRIYEE
jgi:alanine racemase